MGEIVQGAWRNLRRRLSRTFLTVGSITVGMFMVVVVSFLSATGRSVFQSELKEMGMDGISVSVEEEGEGVLPKELALIRSLKEVDSAMPLTVHMGVGEWQSKTFATAVCGIDAGATQAVSLEVLHGRLFNKGDIKGTRRVCLVDESLALARYGRSNIVGRKLVLTVDGETADYQVVGVTVAGSSVLQNVVGYLPDMTFLPYSTLQELSGEAIFDRVAVRFKEGYSPAAGEIKLRNTLERQRRGVTYQMENLASQKERLDSLLSVVTLLLTVISGISLVVSGLGIMTIMLVSVGERTREIGIKKALGASPGRILAEFLVESMTISCLGGIMGLLLGGGAALSALFLWGAAPVVPVSSLLLLLCLETGIGIAFGVYPAYKASRLEPVEAFRSEG